MYSRLKKILTELGEIDLRIHSAYIIKFGVVCLLPFKEVDVSSRYPVTELEKLLSGGGEDIQPPNFTEALGKHPNIFDISILGNEYTGPLDSPWVSPTGILFGGKYFSLRVNLPARLQKYMRDFPGEKKPIEQFGVVSSGSLFAAFAMIHDYPVFTHIGHEYRELLHKQIEKETTFSCPPLGPSPIHPDFYLIFRKKRKKEPPVGMKVYASDGDVFLVFDKNSQTAPDIIMRLFKNMELLLCYFYSMMLDRIFLLEYQVEISNNFSDLFKSTEGLSATPWWRIRKSDKLARLGKKGLSNIHKRCFEFETKFLAFNPERSQVLDRIKQHQILSNVYSYFSETTESEAQIPQALSHALDHFEGELRTFRNLRLVVIASLLGAAVGALLTVFLTQAF